MPRRILATILWAYFGWYLTAMILSAADLPTTYSAVGGVLAATVAVIDRKSMRGAARYEAPALSE
jgi:hypothetical protein